MPKLTEEERIAAVTQAKLDEYETTSDNCKCVALPYGRRYNRDYLCKHIKKYRQNNHQNIDGSFNRNDFINGLTIEESISKNYSDELLNELIRTGEIFYDKKLHVYKILE